MPHRPIFILVPGAWHAPSTWDKITSILTTHQYKSVPITLPSTLSNAAANLLEDITAVRDAITAETTQGRDVVIVAHSYGGFVGASAAKGLTRPKQNASSAAKDGFGHVIGIIMLASGFVQTGSSFLDGFGGKPPPSWKIDSESGFAIIVADPRELFYHDLPEDEGNYWVEQLQKQAAKPLVEGGEHAYAGWKDVPVWFLATTEDRALPIEAQRYFVQAAKDAGADVTFREVESGHSLMLSRPKETGDFMLEAVKYFMG